MTSMAHDRPSAVAPSDPVAMSMLQTLTSAGDRPETTSTAASGGSNPPPSLPVATESRAPTDQHDKHSLLLQQPNHLLSTDERFSQSDPRSAEGSQASNATSTSDQVFTPTPSDTSPNPIYPSGSSQDSQLLQLSAIAAAQDRMVTDEDDADPGSRKRMADGEVKSPSKGHSRNTSTISMASTTSTIGELSSELRTRLSYAMVKVNHGWQARSLDEVESLASQAASPTSSPSTTIHRRSGSSASPQLAGRPMAHVHFANDPVPQRRKSNSPPNLSNRPTLAPPATIRPSLSTGAPSMHPRRNSNPHYTPTLLSHSHSASPRTPSQPPVLNTSQGLRRGPADPVLCSPYKDVREQDAAESLLLMNSPNNSANLKHSFSPAGSPGPNSQPTPRSIGRQPLPGGPRKALPTQRPAGSAKRVGFEESPGMPLHPHSPMDLDSPHQPYNASNRGTPRRRTDAGGTHLRGALSLPSALGISPGAHRKPINDKDIDKMLDRADEGNNSSDDDEIQLPPRRNGVTGAIRA